MQSDKFKHARILIVDDQVANIELLQRMLEHDGYTAVESTTDSASVVAMCAQQPPDLLILDLMLPDRGVGVRRRRDGPDGRHAHGRAAPQARGRPVGAAVPVERREGRVPAPSLTFGAQRRVAPRLARGERRQDSSLAHRIVHRVHER